MSDQSVWRMVRLGTGFKRPADFITPIQNSGMRFGLSVAEIMESYPIFEPLKQETVVPLVIMSGRDLGFTEELVSRWEVIARAQAMGLKLCHPEVGPQLRLQYPDQPQWDGVVIGMEPIVLEPGYVVAYEVNSCNRDRWLIFAFLHDSSCRDLVDTRYVFVGPE